MKKILITIAFIIMGLCASAQGDGFFSGWSDGGDRTLNNSSTLIVPVSPIGSETNENVPTGSGLLIMTAIGACYAIKKRKSK